MPKLIWFNQPTNHSATANFLYLTPDGDVGNFSIYSDYCGSSVFIMGGPVLFDDRQPTDAALTLLPYLSAGFHFYPESSGGKIRQDAKENEEKVSDRNFVIDANWTIYAYSRDYTPTQCRDMLLSGSSPQSPIALVDIEENGEDILACELARIYFGLPKQKRDELGLKHDWERHWSMG